MPLDLSSAFSSMGSAGHHIYSGGHAIGKVTGHGHVLDSAGHKMGSIGHDGVMRDRAGHKIGRIGEDGKIYNKWSSHAQMFTSGHEIIDQHTGREIGTTSGGSLGGAAMLMMLNKDR